VKFAADVVYLATQRLSRAQRYSFSASGPSTAHIPLPLASFFLGVGRVGGTDHAAGWPIGLRTGVSARADPSQAPMLLISVLTREGERVSRPRSQLPGDGG
jgi:hypothetical protein